MSTLAALHQVEDDVSAQRRAQKLDVFVRCRKCLQNSESGCRQSFGLKLSRWQNIIYYFITEENQRRICRNEEKKEERTEEAPS